LQPVLRRAFPILAATVLAACGGGAARSSGDTAAAPTGTQGGAPPTAPPTDATPATAAPPTRVPSDPSDEATSGATVPAALQFSAPLVGGGDIELGALAGRPVLLWFWAPW
jgi:hypothetical protein